jgi:hypothetical protein
LQYEVPDIGAFIGNLRTDIAGPEMQEIMKDYTNLLDG